ncbi:Subtilisin protease SBT1.6 [Spatholobus suberectus]|nr:Subtilisin protease SBT1.6 [Spatholobus suberectus]
MCFYPVITISYLEHPWHVLMHLVLLLFRKLHTQIGVRAAAIRSALITTANPLDKTQSPIRDNGNPLQYASPLAMGAVLYSNRTRSIVQEFRRTVTNVGDGAATYRVKVTQPKGSVVTVSPKTLASSYKHEKQSYSVIIKYTSHKKENSSFGDIVWVENGGARTVRSPIVVAPGEIA